jgi:hypothetical protein
MIGKQKRHELTQAFRMLLDLSKKGSIDLLGATVKSVDKKARTAVVHLDVSDMEIEDVRLQTVSDDLVNGGICLFPKPGSQVVVAKEDGAMESLFIVATSQLESVEIQVGETMLLVNKSGIEFNGGKLGGLTLTRSVVLKLNQLEMDLNTLKSLLLAIANAGTAAGALPLPGSAFSALGAYGSKVFALTAENEISNSKIKQ